LQNLTAILGNAHAAKRLLAMEPADTPQLREILDDIVRDDARAAEIIRHLRRLIQKADAPFQPLLVSELAGEALSIVRSVLLARGVAIIADFAPSLPSVTGDRVQLLQVLLNLILNACDAMEDTPVVDRRVTLTARADDKGQVIVSVADRGTGIAKGRLEKVFEPFVTTKVGGLGLGLGIVILALRSRPSAASAQNPTRRRGRRSP
jgi:two-component system, LuxR family, sensor kinase FixL